MLYNMQDNQITEEESTWKSERSLNGICNLFEETVPILNNIQGFCGQKINLLKESRTKFRES